MSLDISMIFDECPRCGEDVEPIDVGNITHNLTEMAEAAGLYEAMWRPEDIKAGVVTGRDVLPLLEDGIAWLVAHKEEAEKLNPENGWGDYDCLLATARAYRDVCRQYPGGRISVGR